MATAVRVEITRQMQFDEHWHGFQSVLAARIAAVIGAQRAFAQREIGSGWALRQSLVDLASVCELLADELPQAARARTHGPMSD